MRGWIQVAAMVAAGAFAANGCSASSNGGSFASGVPSGNDSLGGGQASGSSSGPAVTGTADAGLPAETKTESNYQSPIATGNIVWVANPTSGLVAYIDSTTFTVQTIEAGDGPTYLAAIPSTSDDVAIVQNVLSQNATLLIDHQGTLSTATFPSTSDANSWAVSGLPSADASTTRAHWAIAWTDATRITNPDPTQGFQNVAVLDVSGGPSPSAAVILTVGYRPEQIAFSADGSHAYAVTQDGISVIALPDGASPSVVGNLPLSVPSAPLLDAASNDASPGDGGSSGDSSTDAIGPSDATAVEAATITPPPSPGAPDVSFTSDGAYAVVRVASPIVTVLSLPDGAATAVTLPSTPTDLTISPTGTFAVAVLRDMSTVALLPLPGIVADPTSFTLIPIPGETVGRAIVTEGGNTALLFTTAAPIDRLTVLSLGANPSFRTVILHAPVLAVFPTDDEQNAIVLHNVTPAPGSTVKGAFSLVPIGSDLPASIISLPAAPTAVAIAKTSDRAIVSLRDDPTSTFGVYLAMMPSLAVTPFTLASPPIAVGIVGTHGYVAQDYAEGRITFLDLANEAVRTITGFDLGARIVTGSDQ